MSAKSTAAHKLQAAVAVAQQESYLSTLLPFCHYEQGLNVVIVQMPKDIAALDEVWRVIQEEAGRLNIKVIRRGKWPTAAELAQLFGSVTWLWEKWIPIGFVTMLVGEPGSGKSFLAVDWVKHILCEIPWPLTTEPLHLEGACAVWVETESSQQLVTTRSQSMGLPMDRLYMPGFGDDLLGQPDLVVEAHRNRIVSAVEDLKPKILIVDSLGGAHTGGENRIEDVRPMLDFLARLARDEKIPIVAVHHLRKRSKGESIEITLDRVRGSSAFGAFARSIIAADRVGELSNLRVIKANLAEKSPPLTFEIDFHQNGQPHGISYKEYIQPGRKRTKVERCTEWVLEQLREGSQPLTTLVEKGTAHGYTRGLLYRAKDMLGEGILVSGDGRKASWALNHLISKDELDGLSSLSEGETEEEEE